MNAPAETPQRTVRCVVITEEKFRGLVEQCELMAAQCRALGREVERIRKGVGVQDVPVGAPPQLPPDKAPPKPLTDEERVRRDAEARAALEGQQP